MDYRPQPKMLVLPKDRSTNARVCTLAHPRTAAPCQYLFDPNGSIYEFTRVVAPKGACKSWLISSDRHWLRSAESGGDKSKGNRGNESRQDPGNALRKEGTGTTQRLKELANSYVMSRPEILVATPIDPLFVLLPALYQQSSTKTSSQQFFLSIDDLLDKLAERSKSFEQVSKDLPIRIAFETRLQAVCDTVDAGDERMYRVNEDKVVHELFSKATAIVKSGLPPSMDDEFVLRALDTPVISTKREGSSLSEFQSSQSETPMSEASSLDSQTSTATSASSVPDSLATEVTTPEDTVSSTDLDVQHLLRVRIILDYMLTSYISSPIAGTLNDILISSRSPINFKPLDERLELIAKIRAEALAARSLGNFSRKRNAYDEDDAAEVRAEKKRKKEEEDKKKKLETRGVRDLKKVDVKGMKKMSDFFGKGVAAKKK